MDKFGRGEIAQCKLPHRPRDSWKHIWALIDIYCKFKGHNHPYIYIHHRLGIRYLWNRCVAPDVQVLSRGHSARALGNEDEMVQARSDRAMVRIQSRGATYGDMTFDGM